MLDRVDSGLTLQQYRLLTLLDAGDERSTALAQRLAVSKPAISTSVEALSSVGYVARRADDDDRRASWLQITGAGQRALRRADEAYAQRLHTVAARMVDPESFLRALSHFAAALEEDLAKPNGSVRDHDRPTPSRAGST